MLDFQWPLPQATKLLLTAVVFAMPISVSNEANACACCTDFGQRIVRRTQLDAYHLEIIRGLRFSTEAELFLGARDATEVEGISGLSAQSGMFDLTVFQQQSRWIFAFRDKEGHSGTLTLDLPPSISVFQIDPREEKPTPLGGQGPRLYKEWKLTSKAVGTGIFSNGMGPDQRITLILQGHGNSCATLEDFTAWTLVVSGSKTEYSLFGNLLQNEGSN